MINFTANNVPRAYEGMLWQLRIHAVEEESRAGKVMAMPGPTMVSIIDPLERVLFDHERDANPFFHLMETIWMLAGENEVEWLLQFNSKYDQYADNGAVRGAYGHRWRYHFGTDQIVRVAHMLQADPTTRRAVMSMWDPAYDLLPGYHDYPCNTHLYFRVQQGGMRKGYLEMTVCNRSNDFFWGMLGANVVHMSILQEVIAHAAGLPIGRYQVFTNNLHVYKSLPNFEVLWGTSVERDLYRGPNWVEPMPITFRDLHDFLADCKALVNGALDAIENEWLQRIAVPMYKAYIARKLKVSDGLEFLKQMPENNDWRKAGEEWIARRTLSSSTSTELLPSTTTVTT